MESLLSMNDLLRRKCELQGKLIEALKKYIRGRNIGNLRYGATLDEIERLEAELAALEGGGT